MKEIRKPGKILLIAALLLTLTALVFYGVQVGKTPEEKMAENPAESSDDAIQAAEQLTFEAEKALQNKTASHISLSDGGSAASGADVQIQAKSVTVTESGVYNVSGLLSEGKLSVDCDGTVVLILDNVQISNTADAAICILNADHALIYLPEGSTNKIISGTEQAITASSGDTAESASGAAVYAKDDLSIAGSGKLTVGGYINNAVASTDHLIVLDGGLELEAMNNGLKGKDSVTVKGGRINICSGNDGIKTDNEGEAEGGTVDIRGGEIAITAFGDGIQAEKDLMISDGTITVTAGDTSGNSQSAAGKEEALPGEQNARPQGGVFPEGQGYATPPSGFGQGGNGMPGFDPGEMPQGTPPQDREPRSDEGGFPPGTPPGGGFGPNDRPGEIPNQPEKEDNADAVGKGIKSGGKLTVSGGNMTVTSADDCLHAVDIAVTGGTLVLSTLDDGIHADKNLTVSGGDITVSKSYEGLEGQVILLSGGRVSVTAEDDGINASGGESGFGGPFAKSDASSLPSLTVSGGSVYVNAGGDGLDSNGDLMVEGGTIIVDGPTNDGNGALDPGTENGGKIVCNGGTVLAIGSSGMAESFGEDSTQCSFIKNLSGTLPAETIITVSDETGRTIFEHTSAKSFNSIVFSDPSLTIGKTYTLTLGEQTETVTIEGITNGNPSGTRQGGDFGGRGRK